MRLDGEFAVKVNRKGLKRTYEIIRAFKYEKINNEIIITTVCGKELRYDRGEYESCRLYED